MIITEATLNMDYLLKARLTNLSVEEFLVRAFKQAKKLEQIKMKFSSLSK